MNEHNENFEALTPDLAALDAGLAELGASERACAPADLEGRILAATSGVVASSVPKPLKLTAPEPRGVLGHLSVKRLDWPMRVAAVITVMIGGWAVFHGVNNPIGGTGAGVAAPVTGSAEAERLLNIWSALEKSGASEKIQSLLIDAAKLESTIGSDDFGEPDMSDPENI